MADQGFVVEREGMRVRGTVEGEGAALLFLHGLTALASVQRGNAPRGYRVAAYDQRGHGAATPVTAPEAFGIGEFVADALAVLDHLGWERPVVCGTSMGAAVALRLALGHPQRVRALALVAPAFGDAPNEAMDIFDAMARGIERYGLEGVIPRSREAQVARGIPVEATRWLDAWTQHQQAPIVAAVRTVSRWAPFPELDALGPQPFPIVIAAWPDDPMHPLALAERIAARTGVPLVRLASMAQAMAHPEAVGAALKPLLDAALAERAGVARE